MPDTEAENLPAETFALAAIRGGFRVEPFHGPGADASDMDLTYVEICHPYSTGMPLGAEG